jgi:FSR family fosmidomycin resistance protein-like MFS transporter
VPHATGGNRDRLLENVTAAAIPSRALERAQRRGIGMLAIAHVVNDMHQSAIPAILPFLIVRDGLSLAAAGTLVLAMNLSSSVVQPLFGHLSDRRSLGWTIPIALVLGGAGTASLGWLPSFGWMLFAALCAGIGIAAFHPEGSRFTTYLSGERRASGMGWFTLGGYCGFALGPIVVTPVLLRAGLHGTAFLVLPAVLAAAVIAAELPRFEHARRQAARGEQRATHAHAYEERDDWAAFARLVVTVALRSTTFLAAVTYVPLFAIRVDRLATAQGGVILAALLASGAIGTIAGGRLADRFDRRLIVALSLAGTSLCALALATLGSRGDPWLVLAAAGFGFALGLSASVVVVLGQEYLPNHIGTASGVTLGLAVSIGGIAVPFFGAVGDRYGLPAIFEAIALFAAAAFASALVLRAPRRAA